MNKKADEQFGTDYELNIALGGKNFSPLSEFSQLSLETRNCLLEFQSKMPEDVYGFICAPSPIFKKMLDFGDEVVWAKYARGDGLCLIILAVLGAKWYVRKKHKVGNIFKQYGMNRRFEHTQKTVEQILNIGKDILGQQKGFSFELLVVHRNVVESLLAPFFIANSMNDGSSEDRETKFYRLR